MSRTEKSDEDKVALQKLRIALTNAGVEKPITERVVSLVGRLQEDIFAPETIAIGTELVALFKEIHEKAKRPRPDIVAEMCASVIHVERVR